ncbi:MAG: trigger factor [Rhodobacter sp.]|uniref:trigger factor n=1 Tax=Pararhodobacter sp. TaxID=2127056 RepID=UPI001D2FAAB7|nr:trigger factor [Pararhodobacter sp.]MCA8882460.1 trigger factor [Paracoccaceae bacterium]MCC0073339.1 trigger factor [Rhodobacter sp.]HPD94081.1 trigger factor [Pararhodobacter sp.]
MQVTETLNDGLKRGYTITVTADELAAKVDEKLREAQPEIEIKGFRKGKVPMAMLKKQFGQRLMGEAMQEAVDGAMQAHFDETGARPAMQPKVEMQNGETWKEGDDVTVALSYEALPEIDEPDFAAITLERLVVKADDAAVTEALENLAKQAQDFEDKDGAAENGDQVTFDFTGRIDGEAFEGGAATDYPLVLGSGQFIPGFEEQLVGAKAGESRDVTVTFPENYGAANLAGKEAVFECAVKAVKAAKAAELTDELAARFGAESLDALKGQIREGLEGEYAQAARAVVKRGLLDALDSAVTFDLPESLVEAEASQIAHQLWHDEHPEVHDHNHGSVEVSDEHRSLAVRRVKLGLLLAEVGRKAEVEVTDAEMTQAIIQQARQYPGQEREFFEFVQKNPQMQQQLRAPLFEDKVVDMVLGKAAVTEKEVSKDDLKAALDALEAEA